MMRKIRILLENPENPANVGTVMRNIYSFDAGKLYLPKGVEVKIKIGTACGTGDKVSYEKIDNAIEFLKTTNFRKIGFIVAEHHKGIQSKTIFDFANKEKESNDKFKDDDLLIFGAEGPGLSKEAMDLCDVLLTIPMFGHMACLNVATTTGIVLYEIARQRVERGSIVLPTKPKLTRLEKINKSIEEGDREND